MNDDALRRESPETTLEWARGRIKAIEARLDALSSRVDSLEERIGSRITWLESRMDARFNWIVVFLLMTGWLATMAAILLRR